MNEQPIAVFDSGLGGLTVVRAIQQQLPGEEIFYFGDTARVPYGTKSARTVLQFAEQDCQFLLQFDPKLVVVACNTASALALQEMSTRVSVPLLGVIEPGATEAVRNACGRPIAVLATEGTVTSGAYEHAIHRLQAGTPVYQQACPSLVPLIEEGRSSSDAVLRMLLDDYLGSIRPLRPAVVVLGCTHYPLVREAIAELMPGALVVDSADATARRVRQLLAADNSSSGRRAGGRLHCYVSDNPQRFREVGGRFLGQPIRDVTWVSPEQFFQEVVAPAEPA